MKLQRLILVLVFAAFLYADVMYEMMTTSEGMMGMDGGETMMSIFLKDDRSRTEVLSKNPMTGEIKNIYITRLDKEVIWILDAENKQYSETKIGEEIAEEEEQTETVVPDIKIEKTGKKKVLLDKMCEEIVISMNVESEGNSMNFTQIMWVTSDIPGYTEIKNFNDKMNEVGLKSSSTSSMFGNKKSFEEFQRKISEIEGFPLEIDLDMTMGSEEMSFSIKTTSVVTKIDSKPISEKVFEIPEGYSLKE